MDVIWFWALDVKKTPEIPRVSVPRRGCVVQHVLKRRTALRTAWQQVCSAEACSKNPTGFAANPAARQGGRSTLGSEAREWSDEA